MKSKTKQTKTPPEENLKFPSRILAPIATFLEMRLHKLQKRRKLLKEEDPFTNSSRNNDNASPDADAEEQDGHVRTAALRGQLDRKIVQTKKALSKIKGGTYGICSDCGNLIDTDRLTIFPEATICVKCEKKREK